MKEIIIFYYYYIIIIIIIIILKELIVTGTCQATSVAKSKLCILKDFLHDPIL